MQSQKKTKVQNVQPSAQTSTSDEVVKAHSVTLKEIKHIDPLSCGKIHALLCGIILGIIFAVVVVFILIFGLASAVVSGSAGVAILFGSLLVGMLISLILIPVYMGFSFLIGLLSAWAYNFIAKKIGGLKVEIKE